MNLKFAISLLLAGLPWDQPSLKCDDFSAWLRKDHNRQPWLTLSEQHLLAFGTPFFFIPLRIPMSCLKPCAKGLLKRVLNASPSKRASLTEIQRDGWFVHETPLTRRMEGDDGLLRVRVRGLYHGGAYGRDAALELEDVPGCSTATVTEGRVPGNMGDSGSPLAKRIYRVMSMPAGAGMMAQVSPASCKPAD